MKLDVKKRPTAKAKSTKPKAANGKLVIRKKLPPGTVLKKREKPPKGKAYIRHVPTRTPLKQCDPEGCLAPGIASCPLVSGQAKPYRYQKGCRAEACVNANSRYYKRLAKDGPTKSNSKSKRKRQAVKAKVSSTLKKKKAAR